MPDTPGLSKSDARVLAQIFEPESASSSPVEIIDDGPDAAARESQLEASQRAAIRRIEGVVQLGESADDAARDAAYVEAYGMLTASIAQHAAHAAPFNNRAQLIRWRYGDEIFTAPGVDRARASSGPSPADVALQDLAAAIRLATPASPASPVPRSRAMLLAQAHTQRAAILYASSKALRKSGSAKGASTVPVSLRAFGSSPDELEAAGAKDFFLGGKYGNEISRAMAVRTNPYAKLCGNIIKEAMRKEMGQVGKQGMHMGL